MIYKLSEQKLTILKGSGIYSDLNSDSSYFYNSVFHLNRFRYHNRNKSVGFRIIKLKRYA